MDGGRVCSNPPGYEPDIYIYIYIFKICVRNIWTMNALVDCMWDSLCSPHLNL